MYIRASLSCRTHSKLLDDHRVLEEASKKTRSSFHGVMREGLPGDGHEADAGGQASH